MHSQRIGFYYFVFPSTLNLYIHQDQITNPHLQQGFFLSRKTKTLSYYGARSGKLKQ